VVVLILAVFTTWHVKMNGADCKRISGLFVEVPRDFGP